MTPEQELRARILDIESRAPHRWTTDEAETHLRYSFDMALAQNADIMERWLPRLEGVTPAEEIAIMRDALRTTLAERMDHVRQPSRAARTA